MSEQQSQQANNQLSNAVLKSQQAITQTFQDAVKQAKGDLTQAQATGNEDAIKNAQEQLNQAQTQLTQAQAAYRNTSEQTQG
ncbi:hypothetical protein [Aneurinibacillus tyrosinisolvens]|jgi:hypothetical protein|uniref:hypothetical protein n=1 Tax=Aneurinibacillus tyrosinisolvens TaxID=1443435 RepID=UPI00063EF55B|nr:hypothetical protein [Aneurinibacillus tyrosinisolvens]